MNYALQVVFLSPFAVLPVSPDASGTDAGPAWEEFAAGMRSEFAIANRASILDFGDLHDARAETLAGLTIADRDLAEWSHLGSELKDLRYLHIKTSSEDIDEAFFQAVTRFRALEHLFLQCPSLRAVPPSIGLLTNLPSLRSLRLDAYSASTVTPRIYAMKTLEELHLGVGSVELPDGISTLPRLKNVSIRIEPASQLRNFPADFERGAFDHVTLVRVRGIARLLPVLPVNARVALVLRCELEQIPSGWIRECRLQAVDFAFNRVREFPTELLRIPSLELVSLDGNAITNIPGLHIPTSRRLKISLFANPIGDCAAENKGLVERGVLVW